MSDWHKKSINKQQIEPLCKKYGISQLEASVLVRRGITDGSEILYFLEDDLRFQHEPFTFSDMEDVVERILQAKDEGERILIYGDSDVDGVSATSILYEQLERMGLDVRWRLPLADDTYGLSMQAVDNFAAEGGSLIITVDCGISNINEVSHANSLGIDVIVTDHHNPPETLPEAIIIINPKVTGSGYPFQDISGAAIAYKIAGALRFSQSDFYGAEVCIMNLTCEDGSVTVDCIKIKNQVTVRQLRETIIPGRTSIYDLKLPYFLQGQVIYVWDAKESQRILKDLFGGGIEFNLTSLRDQICRVMPSLGKKTADDLTNLSALAKYRPEERSAIKTLGNLYVSYCRKIDLERNPQNAVTEQHDIQLVGLAAMADVMPMRNENRIFVRNAMSAMKSGPLRSGLSELLSALKLRRESLTSTDLSWTVIPSLNAAGRMGKSDLALRLLLSKDGRERESLAREICALNEERKSLVSGAMLRIQGEVSASIDGHGGKICLVIDESINKGVTGILAARIMQEKNVPCIAVTCVDGVYVGSMRSCRGIIATDFLSRFGDFFINYGGHDAAAGFSFAGERLAQFKQKARSISDGMTLDDEQRIIEVDAEIPPSYLGPESFGILDVLEPFGLDNPELVLMTLGFTLCDAQIVGKKEPQHLKLTFDTGKHKIPAMYWSQAERLKKDITVGKKYDILYTMAKNCYKGIDTNQLIIKDCILRD